MVSSLIIGSLILWIIIFLLPWQPWRTREQWDVNDNGNTDLEQGDLSQVTVLIPARNEEAVIERTLKAVIDQGGGVKIILINDNSTDLTAEKASDLNYDDLKILNSQPLPVGWGGKLWALEQGRKLADTPYVVLLDADIAIKPGVVSGLFEKLKSQDKDFVSLMAQPTFKSFSEKLLMPAFIYFFKLLYPFHLANSNMKVVAAAAGGCVITKAEVLDKIGGFESLKDALIDDCTLARRVKNVGYKTWLGLTHSVQSVRPYEGFSEIWNMVARTAYTQLNYSILLLLLCTAIMAFAYWVPVAYSFVPFYPFQLALAAWGIMTVTYIPTLHFYRLSWFWAPLLPFIATLYLGMTWHSAIRYWRGERVRWRGRIVYKETAA
ncbi:MAG: glycosyltransferase [Bacteroidota bacterium]